MIILEFFHPHSHPSLRPVPCTALSVCPYFCLLPIVCFVLSFRLQDESDELESIDTDEDKFVPAIHIYFNDDLTVA